MNSFVLTAGIAGKKLNQEQDLLGALPAGTIDAVINFMKLRKITMYVLDFEGMSDQDFKYHLTNDRYLSIKLDKIEEADIGEWHDDHELNKQGADYGKYFRPVTNKPLNLPPSHHTECGWKSCLGGEDCFKRFR